MRNTFKTIIALTVAVLAAAPSFAEKKPSEAIIVKKDVTFDSEGEVKSLVLETYVTGDGENTTTTTVTTKPMDVVLVLDVSGSMDEYTYDKVGKGNDQAVLKRMYESGETVYVSTWTGMRKVTITKKNNSYSATYKVFIVFDTSVGDKVLYKKSSMKKIEALKVACSNFIDSIKERANAGSIQVDHRISIVKFAGDKKAEIGNDMNGSSNYSQIVVKDSKDYDAIKTTVKNFKAGGATSVDYGMEHAKSIIDGIPSTRESVKIVVMFTDGEPNHGSGFDKTVANSAINISKGIKAKATVYSVGTFEDASEDVETYMQYVSSEYPDATSLTSKGSKHNTDKAYTMLATSADELNDVFVTISKTVSSGESKADYYLETSKVTLRDIITPYFQVPEGASVTFKTASFIKPDASIEKNGVWGPLEDVQGVSYKKTKDAQGNTYIDVYGFDFDKNWVGYIQTKSIVNRVETITKTETHGKKLIIEIAIEPDPNFDGGEVSTNLDGSGVIVGSTAYGVQPIVKYKVNPTFVKTRAVNLVVRKSGLQPGESVLYTVTRSGDPDFKLNLVLIADENGNAEAKAKVDSKKSGRLYTYTVVEDGTWAWTYSPVTVRSKTLYNADGALDNVFDFGAARLVADQSKTSLKRGSDAVTNVFLK